MNLSIWFPLQPSPVTAAWSKDSVQHAKAWCMGCDLYGSGHGKSQAQAHSADGLYTYKPVISLASSSRLERCVSGELCLLDILLCTPPVACSLKSDSWNTLPHAGGSSWAIPTSQPQVTALILDVVAVIMSYGNTAIKFKFKLYEMYFKRLDLWVGFFFPLGDKTFKHQAPCVSNNHKCPSVSYF